MITINTQGSQSNDEYIESLKDVARKALKAGVAPKDLETTLAVIIEEDEKEGKVKIR